MVHFFIILDKRQNTTVLVPIISCGNGIINTGLNPPDRNVEKEINRQETNAHTWVGGLGGVSC